MRYGSRIRWYWYIGPVALSLALGGGGCNGPSLALAEEGEVVEVESLEDSEGTIYVLEDGYNDALGSDVLTALGDVSGQLDRLNTTVEDMSGNVDELVAQQTQDAEGTQNQEEENAATLDDVAGQLEQLNSTVESLAEHVGELQTKPLEELAMISTGAIGALLGSVAFGGLWRVMGGES